MSKPQSDGRKNLKRPRGLLASRKNADQGPSTKKPRPDDPQANLDPDTLNAQDWSDLKELYENALDAFYGEAPTSALPLVRGVLHECARLVTVHKDPSVIYSPLESAESSTSKEAASTFHMIHASAWYLMYQFARTNSAVLTEDEPREPVAYLISSLAACEEGQALDVRKQQRAWDLELIWGRALVGIAQSHMYMGGDDEDENEDENKPSPLSTSTIAEFAAPDIPNLLQKVTDRLSYAITHYSPRINDNSLNDDENKSQNEQFARGLLDAAQVVLAVAEHLHEESKDQESETEDSNNFVFDETNFAFAEKLFSQVAGMANIPENIREQATFGEAQALLSMGAAIAEGLEGDGENEDEEKNENEEEEERLRCKALGCLESAVEKFDFIHRLGVKSRLNGDEINPLLLEAIVTLATLLPEGDEQDAMYSRYSEEGGMFD